MSDFVIENGVLKKYTGKGGSVVVPEGVTGIGDYAFSGCSSLTQITLPEGVTSIGKDAFYGCSGLAQITLPEGVTGIGDYAFYHCSSLTQINLPEGLTSIGDYAFYRCSSLTQINLPEGLTSIGDAAFFQCSNLTRITLPEGLISIGNAAFLGCSSLTQITLPEGLTDIGGHAFENCSSLRNVTIPESVTELDSEAFSCCKKLTHVVFKKKYPKVNTDAFSNCKKLQFPLEYLRTNISVPVAMAEHFPPATAEECPYLILFQTAKAWREAAHKAVPAEEVDRAIDGIVALIRAQKRLSEKMGAQAADYALAHLADIRTETLQALKTALEEKQCKKAVETLAADPTAKTMLGCVQEAPKNPLEALVREKWVFNAAVKMLTNVVKNGVKYAGSEELSSPEAVVFVIAAYVGQIPEKRKGIAISEYKRDYFSFRANDTADQVAAGLDRNDLLDLLEELVYQENKTDCLAALGRYADEARAVELVAWMRKWADWNQYNTTGRQNIIIARGALMLNDTRAAMLHMEQVGHLDAYAKLRGTDAQVLRDTALADFGFDAEGKKAYDLGNKVVTASIGQDLTVTLYDEESGKAVKSLPKKGADPEKYAAAGADLSDLKKNVKKVVKARNQSLFKRFLDGKGQASDKWQNAYLTNPVLHRVAELLVWAQGKDTFTLTADGPVDSQEQPYTIGDADIKVAHPMKMTQKDIDAWQKYFSGRGLKQPFEQVWEPVVSPKSITADRYRGAKVSVFKFMGREKDGIHFEDEDFHNELYFSLEGCELGYERTEFHRHEIAKDETFTLGKFSIKGDYTRQANHIVALLDRWTIAERIRGDDVSIRPHLDNCTLAQIMSFLDIATENNCPNCSAMLLAYKQERWPDFDPMAEFTLE